MALASVASCWASREAVAAFTTAMRLCSAKRSMAMALEIKPAISGSATMKKPTSSRPRKELG